MPATALLRVRIPLAGLGGRIPTAAPLWLRGAAAGCPGATSRVARGLLPLEGRVEVGLAAAAAVARQVSPVEGRPHRVPFQLPLQHPVPAGRAEAAERFDQQPQAPVLQDAVLGGGGKGTKAVAWLAAEGASVPPTLEGEGGFGGRGC